MFVQNLVRALAGIDVKCTVINPLSIFRHSASEEQLISFDHSVEANPIRIIRPRYFSFSNKKIFSHNTESLTLRSYTRTAAKCLAGLDSVPDALYGHFLYEAGAACAKIASAFKIPSFIAVGESGFGSIEARGRKRAGSDFRKVRGFIAVSSHIMRALKEILNIPEEKIGVFPNGVDLGLFHPRDKARMRAKLGLPQDKFIVAFTGLFNERKGPHRVLSAVSGMKGVGVVFIGSGKIPLNGKEILFKGALEQSEVPEMLSAADIFLLPTLAEGSCNAVLEALATGLPVITSDREFNDDIVDGRVAIRVNPLDIGQIRGAVLKLRRSPDLLRSMSAMALKRAQDFDINRRASLIYNWMGKQEQAR